MTRKRSSASTTSRTRRTSTSGRFVLGEERFSKISAVEGLAITGAMKKRAAEFERSGLSPAERRRSIIRTYKG